MHQVDRQVGQGVGAKNFSLSAGTGGEKFFAMGEKKFALNAEI